MESGEGTPLALQVGNRGGTAEPSGRLLKDKLRVVKKIDETGRVKWELVPIRSQLSFDKGFFVVVRALQLLTAHIEGTVIVGLAGPSGSGKTAFCEKIRQFLPSAAVLQMDMYNDPTVPNLDGNFDDPRITDYELLLSNLRDLKEGRPAMTPVYDFKTSSRVGTRQVDVPTGRIVIVEGIYALSARLRPLLDLRVSITGGVHFDLVKRVLRDIDRSGQTPDGIIQQVADTVYPMYKAFIEPDLKEAHLRIYNNFNPFSGFMEPTFILKSDRHVTEEQICQYLGGDVKREEVHTVDIYLLPPHEDPETCTSWLRMRNREGKYQLMFEETVTDGDFIISPRITFEVSVRLLGGLMALGYQIGTIMRRRTLMFESRDTERGLTIKLDDIESLPRHVQIHGRKREEVRAAAIQLGLEGRYIPHSYIEQAQYHNLTKSMADLALSEDIRQQFNIDEGLLGTSPLVQSLSWASSSKHLRPSNHVRRPSDAPSREHNSSIAFPENSPQDSGQSSSESSVFIRRSTTEGAEGMLSKAMKGVRPSGTGGVATPEGRKGSGMRQVSKSQVRDGPGWSSQEDVRRLEGTLATLNEKVDSIHSHWSQPLEGVRAGVQELASNMAGLVATVQTTLAAQQALMAKVSLQQETLANAYSELAGSRPSNVRQSTSGGSPRMRGSMSRNSSWKMLGGQGGANADEDLWSRLPAWATSKEVCFSVGATGIVAFLAAVGLSWVKLSTSK